MKKQKKEIFEEAYSYRYKKEADDFKYVSTMGKYNMWIRNYDNFNKK